MSQASSSEMISAYPRMDRSKDSPFLLLIGSHHTEEDFAMRGKEPKDEVKEVAPEARKRNAKLSFAFVYPDKHGCFVLKQFGVKRRLNSFVYFNILERILRFLDSAIL
ncbi:hypothetical protein UlMin_016541 [Ulmus minor]